MLFRREALEAQRTRLYGRVLIATPFRFWPISLFLVGIVAALVVFLATASFSRTEKVPGVIVPASGVVQIRAPRVGVLSDFSVTEGQVVGQGERIGRIVTASAAFSSGTSDAAKLEGLKRRAEHLEKRIEQTRLVDQHDQQALAAKAAELAEQSAQLTPRIELQRRLVAEARALTDRTAALFQRKLTNAETLSGQNIRLITSEQELQRLLAESRLLNVRHARLPAQKLQARAKSELTRMEMQAERAALLNEVSVLQGAQAFDIIAPTAGIVTAVVVSEGYSITDTRPLLSILPQDADLQVELSVPSSAIGFVRPGQAVRLLLDAFPYQRFGGMKGVVSEVTTSVILPGNNETLVRSENPVYRVTVSLSDTAIRAYGEDMSLQPGMQLTANIVLEDRTLLMWLFEPLLSVTGRL